MTCLVRGGLAGLVVGAGVLAARRAQMRWGATAAERTTTLPGDALLPGADVVATRAVAIAAAPELVWPWVAQLGQGRGGLYSYDALENLVGCDMHSADRVVPEWQDVQVGDAFRLHPDLALTVAIVEPGRALVVQGGVPMGEVAPPYDFTWAFVVLGGPDGTARLVVRERYLTTHRWGRAMVELIGVVSFVMSERMLRGVKDRAEALALG